MEHRLRRRPKQDAEEALLESEEKFRTFFEKSPIGIEIYDADGFQTEANTASFIMFGINDDSSSGFNLFNGTSLSEENKTRLRNGEPVSYEASFDFDLITELKQYRTSRTGKADMQYVITPVKSADGKNIQRYILQVHETTEQKRAQQIQKVLYHISNAVATTRDVGELIGIIQVQLGTLVDTTNFYVALFDEETGMLTTPYYKDEVDNISSWPAEKSATGYVIKYQHSLLAKAGDWEPFYKSGEIEEVGVPSSSWLGVPLFIEGKAVGALVVQSYDNPNAFSQKDVEVLEFISHQISLSIQRKKAEQDLTAAMENAQESDRLKSAFLANMSHEIRTPMNAILGFSELLGQSDYAPGDQERFIGIIQNAGQRLMQIINDIVDLSKLEAHQIRIAQSVCNINNLLITIVDSFKSTDLMKKKPGLSLSLMVPPGLLGREIKTDQFRLQQILDNLITNAIKFTARGFIETGVALTNVDGMQVLEFYVKDTGKGIAAEKLDIIFERFRQVEENEYHEGAGLGLSISKALVHLLGGDIRVDSVVGTGTTFRFTIPFIPVENKEEAVPVSPPDQTIDLGRKIIFIAEDDDDSFDYISVLLKETNAEIQRADNGDLLMEMIRSKTPDIVFLDINMPGRTGYDCLKEIRSSGYATKIIAQTAYAMSEEKKRCMEEGCNGYLAKPFTKKNLFESISAVLNAV